MIKAYVESTIPTYTGPWDEQAISHLFKRVSYGVTKNQINEFLTLGHQESVNRILQPIPKLSPPVNNYNAVLDSPDPDVPAGQTWITAPRLNDTEGAKMYSLKGWLIDQMMKDDYRLHTKMVHFWHNLLPIEVKAVTKKLAYQYFDLLHENALGNYKVFIKSLCLNPAMLIYLNGNQNIASAPDENFARELMELFCLGKGPNSKYTENDVQNLAKVFTGWITRWNQYIEEGEAITEFRPFHHDTTDKTFSTFFDNQIITGKSDQVGAEDEIDQALDMIFQNSETALHICRKLYQFFVYSEITEQAEIEVITPLATIFRDNSYDIVPVLEALFLSEHFYRQEFRGALIKSPLEFLLGQWKTLGMNYNNPSDADEVYFTQRAINAKLDRLGLDYGDPPNVAGWPAYYQVPLMDKSWINTDSITFRARLTDAQVNNGMFIGNNGNPIRIKSDFTLFLQTLDAPELPGSLIDELSTLFLGIPPSENQKTILKSILLSGQTDDYYWTDAWNAYVGSPGNEMFRTTVENRLNPFFKAFFQLSEFNLM